MDDIKSKLKDLRKNMKKIKSLASNEKHEEAKDHCKDTIKICDSLLKHKELNEKNKKDILKAKDSILMYIEIVDSQIKFKKKWN